MKKVHRFYLSIGSNIQPEINLPKTINILGGYGCVRALSNAWESLAVGADGPNFLNASLLFTTELSTRELKQIVIRSIEADLGRVRSKDKNAPRTIDIDIIMVDDKPINIERWNHPFVVVPMSELAPGISHPIENQKLSQVAKEMISKTWIKLRPGIFKQLISRSVNIY
jgi:2-amino-4-hydroxy-6-hydroxymethyldihydropteridine diphosphokinase